MTHDDHDPPPLTDDQRDLFRRRVADLDADPDNVLTWHEIKARVLRTPPADNPRPEAHP